MYKHQPGYMPSLRTALTSPGLYTMPASERTTWYSGSNKKWKKKREKKRKILETIKWVWREGNKKKKNKKNEQEQEQELKHQKHWK